MSLSFQRLHFQLLELQQALKKHVIEAVESGRPPGSFFFNGVGKI